MLFFGVTPCVGVWIEIMNLSYLSKEQSVTPCVGVWIEITAVSTEIKGHERHSLRGSVD